MTVPAPTHPSAAKPATALDQCIHSHKDYISKRNTPREVPKLRRRLSWLLPVDPDLCSSSGERRFTPAMVTTLAELFSARVLGSLWLSIATLAARARIADMRERDLLAELDLLAALVAGGVLSDDPRDPTLLIDALRLRAATTDSGEPVALLGALAACLALSVELALAKRAAKPEPPPPELPGCTGAGCTCILVSG